MTPDDYLWDKSGTPDPEVEKLEHALRPLAHDAKPLDLPPAVRAVRPSWWERMRGGAISWPVRALAATAAIAIVAGAVWYLAPRNTSDAVAAWDVARLAGEPKIGTREMRESDQIARGEWLETGKDGRVRVQVGAIGIVDVGPDSRLRVVGTAHDDHRLTLERGGLRAVITAPPRQFFVETPSVLAVDMGCAYRLVVDDKGASLLSVETGWVSFEAKGRESFIPAGAECVSIPGRSPGTPCLANAADSLKKALLIFDFGTPAEDEADAGRRNALDYVLMASRADDALTLWHLLARTRGDDRSRVFDALAARVPAPDGVTREGILAGNSAMFDTWWDALGFGDTSSWRRWRRPWSDVSGS